jgi:hypothetical protein
MQNPNVDFNSIVGTAVTLKTEEPEAQPQTDISRAKFDPADIEF